MSIRIKNIDFKSVGMKRHQMVSIGDITASISKIVFVAPLACKIDSIDIYSKQAMLGLSDNSITITARLATDSDATLQSRGTSATAASLSGSNELSANSRYRLIPSANNCLTIATPIELNFSAQGSGVLSAVLCHVTYTPLLHRENT